MTDIRSQEVSFAQDSELHRSHDDKPLGTLAVIGLGYIGLPTAIVFALRGWDVTGVDVSERTVEKVSRGELPFVEEGLDIALEKAVDGGKLKVQSTTPSADVYIVAVPTPFLADKSADLSYIDAATDGIVNTLKPESLVVLESTSPPGATEHMAKRILQARPDLSIGGEDGKGCVHIAHAPERVLPGKIMIELAANDRIIGGLTKEAGDRARDVYATFCTGTIHLTNARTAEMAKLTENSFRDVSIAFANELSVICDGLDIDVWELIELANKHPRVNILRPGPGVGGHCIAVDPWFIVSIDKENSRMINTARTINDEKPSWVISKFENKLSEKGNGSPVALLGLAFKPDIDDLRESPSVNIAERICAEHPELDIQIVEPNVETLPNQLDRYPNARLVSLESALESSEVVVVLVAHKQFREIGVSLIQDSRVIDTCGINV